MRGGSIRAARAVRAALLIALTIIAVACNNRDAPVDAAVWATLPDASEQLLDGFTTPHAIVERSDGRVYISDPALREVWLADFRSGDRTRFGRGGDGPGEHRNVSALLPMLHDSLAVVSHAVPYRVSVISGDGRPVRTRTLGQFATAREAAFGFEEFPQLTRFDSAGRFYGARLPMRGTTAGLTYLDSVPIMRVEMSRERIDTVAMFATGERGSFRRPNDREPYWVPGLGIYAAINDWVALADGAIVMVDAKTYSLTIVDYNGNVRSVSVQHEHPRYSIGAAEWRRHLDSASRAMELSMRRSLASISAQMGSALEAPDLRNRVKSPDSPGFWPPVLTSTGSLRTANGLLWIPVAGPESPKRKYLDVVSLDGEVKRSFILDSGRYLLEVTPEYIYTFTIDDDDLRWISRHPNPMR